MAPVGAPAAVCLGEALVVFRPEQPGALTPMTTWRSSVGGAEANVAGALVALGSPTTWVSRLGADPFGDFVVRDLESRGVRVLAERDQTRPTGLYCKEPDTGGSRMHYYRSGSAAAAMDAELLQAPDVRAALARCELVHTSGITAGILSGSGDLLAALVEARDREGFRLSVDLNWRPALWRDRDVESLLTLLRAADVLLMGADEAEAVFGSAHPGRLRERIGGRATLVIKSDAHVALECAPDGSCTEVPALRVEVVEPVGAGDGFAAGYLAGLLQQQDARTRLRLGHLMAANVLAERGDHATRLPDAATRRELTHLSEEDWGRVVVSSAGVALLGAVP